MLSPIRSLERTVLAVLVWVVSSVSLLGADPLTEARHQLVARELIPAGINNPLVIAAMRKTPRHEFVPPAKRKLAYFDMALPIGGGQTISPPYIVAFMTEQLDPQPTDRVLEIGTGSGYQAAVLSELVRHVYSIEIVESLGRKARTRLKRLRYKNVHIKIGDGYEGWPEHAPFDKVIVTCSPEKVPQQLIEQLAEGGSLVVPVGERFQQQLWKFTKVDGKLKRESLQTTFFVPMTGRAEELRQILPDSKNPALVNGSFEELLDESSLPRGWYYVRLGQVEATPDAPVEDRVMKFANSTAGRNAHAMQALGLDGRHIQEIAISYWIRGNRLQAGRFAHERPGFIIEFYGHNRAPVGFEQRGNGSGSFAWKQESERVQVPTAARAAVIGIGLFGATGEVWWDDMQIKPTGFRPSTSTKARAVDQP
ncbi:MAG: protein-L-isoaspartate O-methyltransferase [Planctomycetaceae bacterium]|nr:protein-L-isoaspartate O-methyltransferase [Planctomycetaceae bacterium]MBP62805.1 protein-L-isoaspartate O-methyltransferase [Planctomycetaceae bacterium]